MNGLGMRQGHTNRQSISLYTVYTVDRLFEIQDKLFVGLFIWL